MNSCTDGEKLILLEYSMLHTSVSTRLYSVYSDSSRPSDTRSGLFCLGVGEHCSVSRMGGKPIMSTIYSVVDAYGMCRVPVFGGVQSD